MSFPVPPPVPTGSGPVAWEATPPVDPQPQLLDYEEPPPFTPPKLFGTPEANELLPVGGQAEASEEDFLVDPPTEAEKEQAKLTRGLRPPPRVNERHRLFLLGELTVHDLDDEELARGQFRGHNNRFSRGGKLDKIPKAFHEEVIRRILERGEEQMRRDYLTSIEAVKGVMLNPMSSGTEVLKAADMIMTRVAGKPRDTVDVTIAVKPWEQTLRGIIRTPPPELLGDTSPEIVYDHDGELEGDDDEDS